MKDTGKQTDHLKLKVLRALGMAQRAGRLASGEFMTEREIQSFRATLVIVAKDASEQTKRSSGISASFMKFPSSVSQTWGSSEKQSARSSGLRLRSVTRDSQRRF